MLKKLSSITLAGAVLLAPQVQAMSDTPETGYTETKHPIVLAHGLFGFDSILGVDYWYKIPEALQKDGAKVYLTTVANSNLPEVRGEQLITEIERVLAISGAEKVNLIGHSHGGPTTRYVASVRPDLVASVSSISGVNKGTPVAQTLMEWNNGSTEFSWLLENLGNGLATVINALSSGDYEQDILASIGSMTFEEAEVFNAQHPGGIPTTQCGEGDYVYNGVNYYSWAGEKPSTNPLDVTDLITVGSSLFFPKGERNDGLVGACASRLGMVIRDDFYMNHLDETNQLFGLHSLLDTDPVEVFRTHANRLKQAGL